MADFLDTVQPYDSVRVVYSYPYAIPHKHYEIKGLYLYKQNLLEIGSSSFIFIKTSSGFKVIDVDHIISIGHSRFVFIEKTMEHG